MSTFTKHGFSGKGLMSVYLRTCQGRLNRPVLTNCYDDRFQLPIPESKDVQVNVSAICFCAYLLECSQTTGRAAAILAAKLADKHVTDYKINVLLDPDITQDMYAMVVDAFYPVTVADCWTDVAALMSEIEALEGTEQHPQPDNYHLAWDTQLKLYGLLKAMQFPQDVVMNLMANTTPICFQLVDHLNGFTGEARKAIDMTGFLLAMEYMYRMHFTQTSFALPISTIDLFFSPRERYHGLICSDVGFHGSPVGIALEGQVSSPFIVSPTEATIPLEVHDRELSYSPTLPGTLVMGQRGSPTNGEEHGGERTSGKGVSLREALPMTQPVEGGVRDQSDNMLARFLPETEVPSNPFQISDSFLNGMIQQPGMQEPSEDLHQRQQWGPGTLIPMDPWLQGLDFGEDSVEV